MTRKIKTLLVDDEPPAVRKLRSLLATEQDIEVVGEASSGDMALRLIDEVRPELLFLDIQMPPPNGLAVMKALAHESRPRVVFTTAHAEHAVEAFAVRAIDYLLKPYSQERFAQSLVHVRRAFQPEPIHPAPIFAEEKPKPRLRSQPVKRFMVKTNERYVVVRASEISRVEAAANYVVLHTSTGRHILRRTLALLESELDMRRFFRTSRSGIVNIEHVRHVEYLAGGEHIIVLEDGSRVPLTRSLREFQSRL